MTERLAATQVDDARCEGPDLAERNRADQQRNATAPASATALGYSRAELQPHSDAIRTGGRLRRDHPARPAL